MSARYTFLPWVREGAAATITTPEDVMKELPDRASYDVKLTVNTQPEKTVPVTLYGPGDVVSFDPRQVVRTEPAARTADFEPNYFPFIEFDRPDFPWLFTPVRAAGDVLRPWICLIVIAKETDGKLSPSTGGRPAVLTLANAGAVLPDLSESWAWAHAQVAGEIASPDTLESVLATHPERSVSRLICPCDLQPNVQYVGCVVPTTEVGRLAGLGQPIVGAGPHGPAWRSTTQQLELPVYYSWEFATSDEGDFESLARLLENGPPPADAGTAPMDATTPGIGLPSAGVLGFQGALVAPGTTLGPWPDPPRAAFQAALRARLDVPATLAIADPSQPGVIAPPIYGGLHVGRSTIPAARPPWLRELNLDPRHRAVAGLGTRVVQHEQEQLMASAWDQVGEIEAANQALRQAQLARAVGVQLLAEHLEPLGAGVLLQVTQPAQARIAASQTTVDHRVRASRLPEATLTPAFRRIARPSGPLLRRLVPAGVRLVRPLVARLNAGEIAAAPPRRPPAGTVLLDDVSDRLFPSWMPSWLRARLRDALTFLLVLALLVLLMAIAIAALASAAAAATLVSVALILFVLAAWLRSRMGPWLIASVARTTELTPAAVAAVPGRPGFVPIAPGGTTVSPAPTAMGADNLAAARFRAAARAQQQELTTIATTPAPDPGPPLLLDPLRTTVLKRLDPAVTVPALVLARLELPPDWEPDDPLEPVMAAPEFPTPMYEPLGELFKPLLFPGVEAIRDNTVTLLETNPRFIEAYMVGLNHEMGRELLWREYPTDQRGTYFRQFWDPRGRVPAPSTDTEREATRDITPIHTWSRDGRLGDVAEAGKPEEMLVLLIRGRLLKRYPTAVVYASKAGARPGTPERAPATGSAMEERYPIFSGIFAPDVTFLGFALTRAEARGGPAPANGATDPGLGWFFVLQQQPTEPRFGLDERPAAGTRPTPTSFADLTWADVVVNNGHVAVAATAATAVGAIRGPQGQSWGGHAANTAYATMQDLYRVAISADDLLPAS